MDCIKDVYITMHKPIIIRYISALSETHGSRRPCDFNPFKDRDVNWLHLAIQV